MMTNAGFDCYVKDLFNNQAYSDVTIVVDDDQETSAGTISIPAHRLVLATMSDYFRTMLYGNFAEANQSEVRLFEVPHSTFQQCLRFMYFGWDATLDNMSLDEGSRLYSLAQMLLMDAKLKESFSEWITENILKWEQHLWTICSMAVENDFPMVVQRCLEHFSDVANECLIVDAFRTVPLSVVRKVISCKKMNCNKSILLKAVKCWAKSNKIEASVKENLLKSVRSKKAPFFKGKKATLYNNREMVDPKQQQQKSHTQHSYSSAMSFNRCMFLVGVTVVFGRNQKYYVPNQRIKGVIDLKVEIKPSMETDPVVSRTAVVTYDLTKHDVNEVAIFFPKIKICAEKSLTFTFSWTGKGVQQPVVHMFGETTKYATFAQQSVVASIYRTPASEIGHPKCDDCRGIDENDSRNWWQWKLDDSSLENDSDVDSDYSY